MPARQSGGGQWTSDGDASSVATADTHAADSEAGQRQKPIQLADSGQIMSDAPALPIVGTIAGDTDSFEQQVALNWVERQAVNDKMAANVKSVLNNITDGSLTRAQIDTIYDQVLHNINEGDAREFTSINPNDNPIILSPKQYDIVRQQIGQLSGDVRPAAQTAFGNAVKDGRVQVHGAE